MINHNQKMFALAYTTSILKTDKMDIKWIIFEAI